MHELHSSIYPFSIHSVIIYWLYHFRLDDKLLPSNTKKTLLCIFSFQKNPMRKLRRKHQISGDWARGTQPIGTGSETKTGQPDNNPGALNYFSALGRKCRCLQRPAPETQTQMPPRHKHVLLPEQDSSRRQKAGAPAMLSNSGWASEPPGTLSLRCHNHFQLTYLSLLMQGNRKKRGAHIPMTDCTYSNWVPVRCQAPFPFWVQSSEGDRHEPLAYRSVPPAQNHLNSTRPTQF